MQFFYENTTAWKKKCSCIKYFIRNGRSGSVGRLIFTNGKGIPQNYYVIQSTINTERICSVQELRQTCLKTQIREQMSGPEISWYGKSILGCGLWPGLDCGKKGSGPILSNFLGWFFQLFMGKKKNLFEFFLHCSVRTEKLHKIKLKFFKSFFGKILYLRKTSFF